MADIAFLLLIFFLVTTVIETDQGMMKKLPPAEQTDQIDLHKRNLLSIEINGNREILCNERQIPLDSLESIARKFIDNGGAAAGAEFYCDYCKGARSAESSDHPLQAVIQLTHTRDTPYGFYITVQDRLGAAYNSLRDSEGIRRFGMTYANLESGIENPFTDDALQARYLSMAEELRDAYPMQIIETEPK